MEPTIYKPGAYKMPGVYNGDDGIYKGRGVYNDGAGGGNTVNIGGRTYRTVTINGITWLAENLDYKFSGLVVGQGSSTTEPRANYYNNDEATYGVNGNKYGLLYNWIAVKYIEDNKSELIPGWHVSTTTEWDALSTAVGGSNVAGTKLKSKTGWISGNGTDDFGFTVFPAGLRQNKFVYLGEYSDYWTPSEYSPIYADMRFFYTTAKIYSNIGAKSEQYSVRIVKDY